MAGGVELAEEGFDSGGIAGQQVLVGIEQAGDQLWAVFGQRFTAGEQLSKSVAAASHRPL